jgi:uncharacterized protein HemX
VIVVPPRTSETTSPNAPAATPTPATTPTPETTPTSETTTAPAAAESSSSSSAAWLWLLVIAAVGALIAGVVMFVRRHNSRLAASRAWTDDMSRKLTDVRLGRDLLDDATRSAIEPARLDTLRHQIDATAAELSQLAARAPSDDARARTTAAEQALRGYLLAVEGEFLLRDSTTPPTSDAVAEAAVNRRSHAHALDEALTRLDELRAPPQ